LPIQRSGNLLLKLRRRIPTRATFDDSQRYLKLLPDSKKSITQWSEDDSPFYVFRPGKEALVVKHIEKLLDTGIQKHPNKIAWNSMIIAKNIMNLVDPVDSLILRKKNKKKLKNWEIKKKYMNTTYRQKYITDNNICVRITSNLWKVMFSRFVQAHPEKISANPVLQKFMLGAINQGNVLFNFGNCAEIAAQLYPTKNILVSKQPIILNEAQKKLLIMNYWE
jgi:hypothetical protein